MTTEVEFRSEVELRLKYQRQYFELVNILKLWHQQSSNRCGRKGNSPNHGHSVAGVWDSDNGEIATTACAECKLWAKAIELST
jgi:hypothetical protein